MSKSLGNFKTVRDVAKVYGYEPIRYLMISSSYRSPINYSIEIIEQCKASLSRLYTCRDSLDFELKNAPEGRLPSTRMTSGRPSAIGNRTLVRGFALIPWTVKEHPTAT